MDAWKRHTMLLVAAAAATLALAGPVTAHDSDDGHGNGFHDAAPAGEIASYDADTDTLVIDLAKGGSVSGLVTSRTWIMSDDGDCDERRARYGNWCRRGLSRGGHEWGDHWRHGRGDSDELVPGRAVEDALLVLKDGRAFFWKVELAD
jgi:hypothetical protein